MYYNIDIPMAIESARSSRPSHPPFNAPIYHHYFAPPVDKIRHIFSLHVCLIIFQIWPCNDHSHSIQALIITAPKWSKNSHHA